MSHSVARVLRSVQCHTRNVAFAHADSLNRKRNAARTAGDQLARSGFVQRQSTDNPTFAPRADDVVLYPRPLDLATFVRTLAMLLMQLEDLGACIDVLAVGCWSGRWWSTGRGRVRSQKVAEELGHRMSITCGYSSIEMPLPAEFGIKVIANHPTGPPRSGEDFPPVWHRAIELQLELTSPRHNRGIRGREPRHSAFKPGSCRSRRTEIHQPYGAFPFGIGTLLIRPSRAAAWMSAEIFWYSASGMRPRR